MSALSFTEFKPASRQLIDKNQHVLTGIFANDVNLASWQRSVDTAIADYYRRLSFAMPLKRIIGADTVLHDIGFTMRLRRK
ncbi:hypothetical protein [Rheinheimera baltica]|uniref:hypothetical protein n=1 Tax=Rheinheimera baltica TaxID=67576 RepID=UPI00273E542D|nr:hypothetical protein [Rheinheimera baltica]MDP5188964.1 hypothetical protein [Rheinheimera baltica]